MKKVKSPKQFSTQRGRLESLIERLRNVTYSQREDAEEALIKFGKASVIPLINTLRTADVNTRHSLVNILGSIGDKRAVEPIIDVLISDSSNRAAAAAVLGEFGDTRAMTPLIAALQDKDDLVRKHAATALGKLAQTAAVDPLVKTLTDNYSETRKCAAEALDHLGWTPGDNKLRAIYFIAKGEWHRCVALGSFALKPLIQRLSDTEPGIRLEAVKSLAALRDKRAIEPLILSLKDYNERVRLACVAALGDFGGARGVEALASILGKTSFSTTKAAIKALGQLGDSQVISAIVLLLGDEHWQIRQTAAISLDSLGWQTDNPEQQISYANAKQGKRNKTDKMVVLLGEDESDIRDLATFTLRFAGFSCIPTRDGQEALERAAEDLPDLILLDVRMPRMTGYEACRQLKALQETRDIPVVFLSAKGQESEIQAGLDAGAEEYLLKPFAPDQLVSRIKDILVKFGK